MGSPDSSHHGYRYDINGRIMIAAVIVLFVVVLFVFLLHMYARWFWRYSARMSRRRTLRRRRFYFEEEVDAVRLRSVGLDSKVLEALPMFVYKAQDFSEGLDCAVCLSEFQENEKGRVLPKCRHSFHIECIDMWFHSHSTCPLCRVSAQPDQAISSLETAKMEEVSNSAPALEVVVNEEQGQTSSEQGAVSGRRTLPQIAVDIPKRRTDSFSSPRDLGQVYSPNGSSSKSPVSHLRSLSRMLSRDRDRDRKVFPDLESADGAAEEQHKTEII
uniref:RING-type E3 ubiquitin transferase n=1 Tax=Araucaria cunninghamii TaxID=56994 RepID=A0A0D6R6C7_ARACU